MLNKTYTNLTSLNIRSLLVSPWTSPSQPIVKYHIFEPVAAEVRQTMVHEAPAQKYDLRGLSWCILGFAPVCGR